MSKEKGNKLFHYLDRYIGIPIVFLLGIFKRKRKLPSVINEIGILNLGSIGDNVLMSATILDLRQKYPDSKIRIFTGSSNYDIVKMIPTVDEIVKLPITNFLQTKKIIDNYKSFDVFVDFGPWPRINAIYSYLFSSKFKIGFKTKNQFRHYIYDQAIEHSGKKHEVDNHRSLIRFIYDGVHNNPRLVVTEFDLTRFGIDATQKIAVFHPWSAGLRKLDKQWNNDSWVQLYENISKDYDKIIITGAPSDIPDSDELLSQIRKGDNADKITSMAGKLSLSETIYLINISSFIFCVDTGIAHIAAALDKPQVCLQGPANSLRWRPYSDRAIVINPSHGTFGYISLGFEKNPDNTNCMDNIKVEDVLNKYYQKNK